MSDLVERLREAPEGETPMLNGRSIYECANQLGGYVDPGTPDDLAQFLLRESDAAGDLANAVVALLDRLVAVEKREAPEPPLSCPAIDAFIKDRNPPAFHVAFDIDTSDKRMARARTLISKEHPE